MRTKDRLAKILRESGLTEMAKKAEEGYYDDFESELATPIVQLVEDLRQLGRHDLALRAINGEFDSTKEEAEAYLKNNPIRP